MNLPTNTYRIGSHMYGLNTETSDVDTMNIYHDAADYLRIFKYHPEVSETNNNNDKLYSLAYYAELVVKGNPNLVELINVEPVIVGSEAVSDFMALLKDNEDYLLSKNVLKAYRGHLLGIEQELQRKGVTGKRLSHALRICYSLNHAVLNRELFVIRDHPNERENCLDIKKGEVTPEVIKFVASEIALSSRIYEQGKEDFPANEVIKKVVNMFFEDMYG